jgi:nucleoside-diphosphate-sugar epimerase
LAERVLVTGAGGFIGRHVVEELCKLGHRVIATDLSSADLSPATQAGAETAPADLRRIEDVRRLMENVSHVVHIAAAFDLGLPLPRLMEVNRDATRLLCEEAGSRGVAHFLHFSTGGVYGKSLETPMREDHAHHPIDAYSLSKEAGENVVVHTMRKYSIPITIFRPTAVYGPYGKYVAGAFYVLPSILRCWGIHTLPSARGGKSLTMVSIYDITGAVSFCLNNPSAMGEDFNLAEDEALQAGEFFDILYDIFGFKVSFRLPYPTQLLEFLAQVALRIPMSLTLGPVNWFLERAWEKIVRERGLKPVLKPHFDKDFLHFLMGDHYLDNSKLLGIGYKSRYPSCREGLQETIDWYREEGWLP